MLRAGGMRSKASRARDTAPPSAPQRRQAARRARAAVPHRRPAVRARSSRRGPARWRADHPSSCSRLPDCVRAAAQSGICARRARRAMA
eukprot:60650-Prymnesium_polylepis.2